MLHCDSEDNIGLTPNLNRFTFTPSDDNWKVVRDAIPFHKFCIFFNIVQKGDGGVKQIVANS